MARIHCWVDHTCNAHFFLAFDEIPRTGRILNTASWDSAHARARIPALDLRRRLCARRAKQPLKPQLSNSAPENYLHGLPGKDEVEAEGPDSPRLACYLESEMQYLKPRREKV